MTDYVQRYESPRFPFERAEAERIRDSFASSAAVSDGVVRWSSNGSVPPRDILDFWAHLGLPFDLALSVAAREKEQAAFLAAYRANQRPASEEQMAEMRAAFGPGEVVVDVISGRRTVL